MNEFWIALGLALLPAAGNFAGGALAEIVHVSQRTLSLALHAAAGIVLGVVSIELLPEALRADPPWVPIAAFVAGGGFFILVDQALDFVQERLPGDQSGNSAGWAIYFGVAVDLFSDGIMIGTGTTIAIGLAVLLALAQVSADLPEGFATIAAFKRQGLARRTRLLLAASFTIPILLGTTIGYWAVRGRPEIVQFSLLAFTAGVLTTVVVEEMMPEAHREADARFATLVFVGGFALFALLSAYLG